MLSQIPNYRSQGFVKRIFQAMALVTLLAVVGCDTDVPPEPTLTPTLVIVPASPTVAPVAPSIPTTEGGNVNQLDFTPRAPELSSGNPGELPVTVTPTPAPTESTLPVQFAAPDGLVIASTLYPAPSRPAPTVLLLHMAGSNRSAWNPLAQQLQATGFNVVAIDLRGHGDTGGTVDWPKAQQDIGAVLTRLNTLPGVDRQRISIVGANIGANLALNACAVTPNCKAAVLLSPALDYQGIKTAEAMARYGKRPILIVANRNDSPSSTDSTTLDKLAQGDHKLQLYDGSAHGTALLSAHADLLVLTVEWLATHK
jgi:pimeloyl-ACP methyl ester carboxylesterase